MYIPTITLNENNMTLNYDIFSRLLKDRIILINGEINNTMAQIVISQLLYLDSVSNEDIHIYINSEGGSISDGLAIIDTMNLVESDINTTVIGLAASMASIIASSGKKGKRFMTKNSEFMIHQPMTSIPKGSQQSDISIVASHISKLRQKLEIYVTEIHGSMQKLH